MANNNSNSNNDPFSDAEPKNKCIICGQKNTTRKCTMCSRDLICSVACQYSATIDGVNATHSTICVDLPRTTADILFKSIIINQIPTDQKTLSDYRFNDFNDQGKRMLVTLYKHALVYDDISTRELDIWMKDNILFKRMGMQLDLRQHFLDVKELRWFEQNATKENDGTPMNKVVQGILKMAVARKECVHLWNDR
ncbi:hypothetical protein K4K52_012756 [Colletotrichum sp. SAR 10_76]|nr:hypothetical protein K4K52_012756 [Colletotrichum sp. SAR 10_76]